jgi:hypothetical protein
MFRKSVVVNVRTAAPELANQASGHLKHGVDTGTISYAAVAANSDTANVAHIATKQQLLPAGERVLGHVGNAANEKIALGISNNEFLQENAAMLLESTKEAKDYVGTIDFGRIFPTKYRCFDDNAGLGPNPDNYSHPLVLDSNAQANSCRTNLEFLQGIRDMRHYFQSIDLPKLSNPEVIALYSKIVDEEGLVDHLEKGCGESFAVKTQKLVYCSRKGAIVKGQRIRNMPDEVLEEIGISYSSSVYHNRLQDRQRVPLGFVSVENYHAKRLLSAAKNAETALRVIENDDEDESYVDQFIEERDNDSKLKESDDSNFDEMSQDDLEETDEPIDDDGGDMSFQDMCKKSHAAKLRYLAELGVVEELKSKPKKRAKSVNNNKKPRHGALVNPNRPCRVRADTNDLRDCTDSAESDEDVPPSGDICNSPAKKKSRVSSGHLATPANRRKFRAMSHSAAKEKATPTPVKEYRKLIHFTPNHTNVDYIEASDLTDGFLSFENNKALHGIIDSIGLTEAEAYTYQKRQSTVIHEKKGW